MTDDELKKALAEVTPHPGRRPWTRCCSCSAARSSATSSATSSSSGILENIRKENKIETDEQFHAALKQEGLTLAELRKTLEKQMVINRVQQAEVIGRKSASRTTRRAATTTSTRRVHDALLDDGARVAGGGDDRRQDAQRRPDEDAKAKAEAFWERVAKGETFEKLARAVGRRLEGQRRPGRAAEQGRAGPGAAEDLRRAEGWAAEPGHAHVAGLAVAPRSPRRPRRQGAGLRRGARRRSATAWRTRSAAARS